MTQYICRFWTVIIALVVTVSSPFIAQGQEFYKDKTIHFIVGYSAGGLFDTYTRLISRHFTKHVPGNPTIVVENMTGAGGMIAANHIYNRAKPDGLTIGAWAAPLILQQLMGNEAAKFDGRKFAYVGVPSPYDTVCTFNRASGIKSADDWFASPRPLKIAGIAPGTGPSDVPKLLKVALGLTIEVIDGYKGAPDSRIAVESGEVDGFCGPWQSVRTFWRAAFKSGEIRPVLQVAPKPDPDFKDVPLAVSYAKTPEARQLITIAHTAYGLQFPYSMPPGTPEDRLQIIQRAFIEALRDPGLLAEAKKSDLGIDPTDGATTAKAFSALYEIDRATISKLSQILVPKKK
jgi:tripartite-type tricarboxylate transporter receptor subunit TctC